MGFVWNVVASMIASLLVLLLIGLLSRTARDVLIAAFGRFLHIDVETVFRNPREAAPDVQRELERAAQIALMTGRGAELQRETFAGSLSRRDGIRRRFRVLLPETSPPEKGVDWTADREAEIAAFDDAYGDGLLRHQIRATERFLEQHLQSGIVELRSFNYPHIGRLLITDRVVYFTPYRNDAHSRDCRVIKYRRGGEMYASLDRLFNKLWSSAAPYEEGQKRASRRDHSSRDQ